MFVGSVLPNGPEACFEIYICKLIWVALVIYRICTQVGYLMMWDKKVTYKGAVYMYFIQ